MHWIWKDKKWPSYHFNEELVTSHNAELRQKAGILTGSTKYLKAADSKQLIIEFLSQEAMSSSEIEGDVLNRDSVQSSIKKHLGLKVPRHKIQPKEYGIAEMMVSQHQTSLDALSHEMMHEWNTMLLHERRDVGKGSYRTHAEPMQIVSGNYTNDTVYYEAPPSNRVEALMDNFVHWFNTNSQSNELSIIAFAAHTHLRFEQIHPYEDGNGRIGRALIEKAIATKLGAPFLSLLAKIIEKRKKEYYALLQFTNHTLQTDKWLLFFAECILESQDYGISLVDFVIHKYHFMDKYTNVLNARQEKVVLRIFQEGIDGFQGGLSAANYKTIAKTSDATTTRDLQDLVAKGAFKKTGKLKGTRYWLELK
jgi:Fic family protein